MSWIFEGVLDAFKLIRFQPNFKHSSLWVCAECRPSKTSSRKPALARNVHNPHRLQQQLQQCHRSLRMILMPSNSSDFYQILNIGPSWHLQTIHDIIKDTSPNKENQNHHQHHQELKKCRQSSKEFLMHSN